MPLADLTAAYAAGPGLVRAAVRGLTRDQLLARPGPGAWSVLEVVAHLADFEPVYVERMKRVIAFDKPLLLEADENGFASHLAYQDRDLDEELAVLEATNRAFVRVLRTFPEAVLDRPGVHTARGLLTFAQLLTGTTNHVKHHLPFVAAKRAALGA